MSNAKPTIFDTAEGNRLRAIERGAGWRRWGGRMSASANGDRCGEDYSPGGTAWGVSAARPSTQPAPIAGARTGIAGFGDQWLHWCLSLGLWNGQDAILKERLFGLTNSQGNHGEDVKELYFYLDGTPTHSYMRMLYKYPQAAFPYADLVRENARRGTADPEYELVDTGVFAENRYFDVVTEYAKASPDDILMTVSVTNRGPDAATLHLLPHLVARNTWSWNNATQRPHLKLERGSVMADHSADARHAAGDRRDARVAVLRERDECASTVRHERCRAVQGRHQRVCRAWREGCRQHHEVRHEVRGASDVGALHRANAARCGCASAPSSATRTGSRCSTW